MRRSMKRQGYFQRFDKYLIQKWYDSQENVDFESLGQAKQKKVRRQAYHNLQKQINGENVADAHTIRKWFGLNGFTKPNREKMFRLAFAVKLSPGETQEYLIQGLRIPGIQINDYREMIYLYGLERELTFDGCNRMIHILEKQVSSELVLEQNTHTEQLWEMYEMHRMKEPEDFLLWLCENAGMFKGYSKTAWNAFIGLKNEIHKTIREEALECLQMILQETDYSVWREGRGSSKELDEQAIRQYVKNECRRKNPCISKEMAESIRWFTGIAYSEKNSDLISELYAAAMCPGGNSKKRYREKKGDGKLAGIHLLTDKQLSQLLTVAEQKEKVIRLSHAGTQLEGCEEKEPCPRWIEKILKDYYGKEKSLNVKDAKKEIFYHLQHQKQSCHLISREDLLPLLHYVAQHRYLISIGEDMGQYDREDAVKNFERLANTTLSACQMALLNQEYELDYLLLTSFRENDMYSLSDLIEEAESEEDR